MVVIKATPGDWRVDEELGWDLAGSGEHLYLFVEKENLNTLDVARGLARHFAVSIDAIGYAGLKDKHAITRQWFSIPTANLITDVEQAAPAMTQVVGGATTKADSTVARASCLRVGRHSKKLRRGRHAMNHFRIVLRSSVLPSDVELTALQAPFPNIFGPQRLGGENISQALRWLANRRDRRVSAQRKSWHLSVLRSHLFNQIAAHRLSQHIGIEGVDGDVRIDGETQGPLWGRGRSAAQGAALRLQQQALVGLEAVCEQLEYAGVVQGLRPFWVTPVDLQLAESVASSATITSPYTDLPQAITLSFGLRPGAYATAFLKQHFAVEDDSR